MYWSLPVLIALTGQDMAFPLMLYVSVSSSQCGLLLCCAVQVDADVSLRNDVPEGLEVWADSGRIIQVSLLGPGIPLLCRQRKRSSPSASCMLATCQA